MINTLDLLESAADSIVATAIDVNITGMASEGYIGRFEGKNYLLYIWG